MVVKGADPQRQHSIVFPAVFAALKPLSKFHSEFAGTTLKRHQSCPILTFFKNHMGRWTLYGDELAKASASSAALRDGTAVD